MQRADDALAAFEKSSTLIRKSDLIKEVKENADLIHHYNAGKGGPRPRRLCDSKKEAETILAAGAEAKDNRIQIRLAHELIGSIALEQQEYVQAVRELRQANQQNPYNLYRLALAYQGTGTKDEARKYCTAAARFNGLPN